MTGGSWTATAIDITSSTILAATTIAQPQTATLNFTAIGPSTRVTLTATAASSTFTITAIPLNFTTWTAGTIVTTVCSKDGDAYRYGFNGKLKDNEWSGIGNHLDYGARNYDARIGRPISTDPLTNKFPMLSPYQFFNDNPVENVDLDGREGISYRLIKNVNGHDIPVARVIEADVYIAVNKKGRAGAYSEKEAAKVEASMVSKFNEHGYKDESGLPVTFKFNFKAFDPESIKTDNKVNDVSREVAVTQYTVKGTDVPFKSRTGFVMYNVPGLKDEDPNHPGKLRPVNGITTGSDMKINPARGIYPEYQAESHEATHFFLQAAGASNESPDAVDDHSLGGWMHYGTRTLTDDGVKVSGVDNNFSPEAAQQVIKSVPRVEDRKSN
ncbi:MAG: hypothetical protein JSS96_11790 [Bacteroidetes bacterium]|nr:hypothetical protein [Bacteroidota bacterium]